MAIICSTLAHKLGLNSEPEEGGTHDAIDGYYFTEDDAETSVRCETVA